MKYTGEIILAVLFLYVIALGVVTYDEVFNSPPHLFPPPLEKEVIQNVKKFTSTDPNARGEAQQNVLNIEDFVTVPVLIHYLTDDNPEMRKMADDTLQRIGQRLQGHTQLPNPVPAAGSSQDWAAAKQAWRQWAKDNEQRL